MNVSPHKNQPVIRIQRAANPPAEDGQQSRQTYDPEFSAPTDKTDAEPASGFESKAEFSASDQRFLRLLLIVFAIVFGVQWLRAVLDRPAPLVIERGDDFQQFFRVDVNTATWIEWMQLEGIGITLAHRIEADVRLNGPFGSIDEVQRVPGIGPKTLDRIRPWLTISHEHENSEQLESSPDEE